MNSRSDTVSIDWYQGTLPHNLAARLIRTISQVVAEPPKCSSGRLHPSKKFHYPHGAYWLDGAIQLHHFGEMPTPRTEAEFHASESLRAWLIVQGSACSQLGFSGVHTIAHQALLGGTCKRIDIRRDLCGEGLSLVEDVISACEDGYLRHARQFQTFPIKSAEGKLIGNGCYLGSGKSERFVRCYDKGLEQGTHPAGSWHRYEVELKADHAHLAACCIFGNSSVHLALENALRILLGVADFRIGPRGQGNLDRMPRPPFWERFVGDLEPVRPALPKRDPNVARYAQHLAVQLSAAFGAARQLGISVHRVMDAIGVHYEVTPSTLENPLVDLIVQAVTRGDDAASDAAESSQASTMPRRLSA